MNKLQYNRVKGSDIMQTKEEIGNVIANAILSVMKEKAISEEELLKRLGRKTNLFSRFMYDVRNGNLTLQSIVNIANALEIDTFKIINQKFHKEVIDLKTLIQKGVNSFNPGDIVDLPKLLDFMWPSLNFGERKKIGKEVYNEVLIGNYSDFIKFHHKTSSNHAYYEIV